MTNNNHNKDKMRDLIGSLNEVLRVEASPSRFWPKYALGTAVFIAILGIVYLYRPGSEMPEKTIAASAADAGERSSESLIAALASDKPESEVGHVLDVTGYVVPNRVATVSSLTTGRLVDVLVHEGDHVVKGQLLAQIDPATIEKQIVLAEAQLSFVLRAYERLKVDLTYAKDKLDKMSRLHEKAFSSDSQLDSAEYEVSRIVSSMAQTEMEIRIERSKVAIHTQNLVHTNIYAPFDGFISDRSAEVGEIVSPISTGGGFTRSGIFTVVDANQMSINVQVNENYINRVYVGQEAKISLRGYPEIEFTGHIRTIIPSAERDTASFKVIVAFQSTGKEILPNMSVDLSFIEGGSGDQAAHKLTKNAY